MRTVEANWTARHKNKAGGTNPPSAASVAKIRQWRALRSQFHLKGSIGVDKDHPNGPTSYMHDKVAVADTGSFNFSTNATHNAENILIINNAGLADQYGRLHPPAAPPVPDHRAEIGPISRRGWRTESQTGR